MARALSLPLSVLVLAQTLSISDTARAFRERMDMENEGVILHGVDAAEFSPGKVSVSGVRIPVRFEGPARSGADEQERSADTSSDVASDSASGSACASEASSSLGRTA